jgi:hypothetical protein
VAHAARLASTRRVEGKRASTAERLCVAMKLGRNGPPALQPGERNVYPTNIRVAMTCKKCRNKQGCQLRRRSPPRSYPILTSFSRLDVPLLIETSDLRRPKCLATSSMSSALALPPEGGDRSCANHAPVSSCCSALAAAPSLTFTSTKRDIALDGFPLVASLSPKGRLRSVRLGQKK